MSHDGAVARGGIGTNIAHVLGGDACGRRVGEKGDFIAVGVPASVDGIGPHIIGGIGSRSVRDDVKDPQPVLIPDSILSSKIVGVPVVFQQNPCWVGLGAPRSVTSAVATAAAISMSVTASVVTVAVMGRVVKIS